MRDRGVLALRRACRRASAAAQMPKSLTAQGFALLANDYCMINPISDNNTNTQSLPFIDVVKRSESGAQHQPHQDSATRHRGPQPLALTGVCSHGVDRPGARPLSPRKPLTRQGFAHRLRLGDRLRYTPGSAGAWPPRPDGPAAVIVIGPPARKFPTKFRGKKSGYCA